MTLAALATAPARAGKDPIRCLRIDAATAYAPRGEIYIELVSSCDEDDFERGDPISGTLEVLLSNLPPTRRDIQVYKGDAPGPQTIVFDNLDFSKDDAILVRLTSFGDILGLRTVTAR